VQICKKLRQVCSIIFLAVVGKYFYTGYESVFILRKNFPFLWNSRLIAMMLNMSPYIPVGGYESPRQCFR
jgi:hypothetical protein